MFLISWNVAGWSATSAAIRESYGSVEVFFELTGADIICLQECKGTWSKLESSPVEMGAADPPLGKRPKVRPLVRCDGKPAVPLTGAAATPGGITGWESFWSLSSKAHRGFNGVVTFVRKGLTLACDNRPFEDVDFNDEGRVVVTYHSLFTLVNMYVPNARGGSRSDYKKKFLLALRQEVLPRLRRETGKPVVLVGDLNCTYRAQDAHWTFRRLHLPRLLELQRLAQSGLTDKEWHTRFPHLPRPTLERVTQLTANTLCALLLQDDVAGDVGSSSTSVLNSPVALDASLNDVDDARGAPCAAALTSLRRAVEEAGKTRRELLYSTEPAPVGLEALINAGLLSVHAADMTKSFPFSHNEDVFTVVQHVGLAPHSDESIEFLGRLLQVPIVMSVTSDFTNGERFLSPPEQEQGGGGSAATATRMWDTFLLTETDGTSTDASPPYCPCPFTVWDQSKNRRLANEGSRIDFILVDDDMRPLVVGRGATENNTGPTRKVAAASPDDGAFFSELKGKHMEDGIYRAMAGGAYTCASYDGTGIPPLADSARDVPFRGLPSTGLFVTPPQFSDHIGVCVRFKETDENQRPFVLTPRSDKLVERNGKCLYRPPVGLHSFFQRKGTDQKIAQVLPTPPTPAEPPRKAARTANSAIRTDAYGDGDVVEISSGDE